MTQTDDTPREGPGHDGAAERTYGAGDGSELTTYGATKAALDSITRSQAAAYGRFGIRVNAVAPGLIITVDGGYQGVTAWANYPAPSS